MSSKTVSSSKRISKKMAKNSSQLIVQDNLRWDCSTDVAKAVCLLKECEPSGYWQQTTFRTFITSVGDSSKKLEYKKKSKRSIFSWIFGPKEEKITEGRAATMTFYDSITGKPLFMAPRGRSNSQFKEEIKRYGWPVFRDEEIIWENIVCREDGELISIDGTYLGKNSPDAQGNRYCVNLVAIAGRPQ